MKAQAVQVHPLKKAREERHLSQADLADHLGTTPDTISRWERGKTQPYPHHRNMLVQLLGRSAQELGLLPEQPDRCLDPLIPQPSVRLVGRTSLLTHIKQRLFHKETVALTALNGLPGVGKTAVAVHLAYDEEVRSHFKDGILWAGLGPSPNLTRVFSRWGTLLGLAPSNLERLQSMHDWQLALRTAIGDRTFLLIIDDAWTLEASLLFRLISGPHCACLLTTRFPGLASSVAVKRATPIHELDEEDSLALLSSLAPQAIALAESQARLLIRAVGGLPLALTLVGNYLRQRSYTGQKRRISSAFERIMDSEKRLLLSEPHVLIESHPALPLETHISLQSIISFSDHILTQQARAALYSLSVFPAKPSDFSEAAALAVAACPVETLDELLDAGLLESRGSDRYTLHQTIADYASLQLRQHQAAEYQAHKHLIAYATTLVEAHPRDYELLDSESTTILQALEMAFALEQRSELIRLAYSFAPFLFARGWYAQAGVHIQRGYEAACALKDSREIIRMLHQLGEIKERQGHLDQAKTALQDGLTLARQLGDNTEICTLLHALGMIIWCWGDNLQADLYLEEGLVLARQLGDRSLLCRLFKTLGSVNDCLGRYDQAIAYLREGLTLARQMQRDGREYLITLLMNIGVTIGKQGGDRSEVEACWQEALSIAREIGQKESICILLADLGDSYIERGHYDQAEVYLQEGVQLARQTGLREFLTMLLINTGIVKHKQGHYEQSEQHLQEALQLAQQVGRLLLISDAHYYLGQLYLDTRQIEQAEANFRAMFNHIPLGSKEFLALAHYGLGRVAAARGDLQEARRLGQLSLSVFEAIHYYKAPEVRAWFSILPD